MELNSADKHHNADPWRVMADRVADLIEGGDRCVEQVPAITDAATANRVKDFAEQVRQAAKDCEDGRKAEKQPHLDAGKAIDKKWRALTDNLAPLLDKLKRLQTEWLQREQRRLAEEREKARRAEMEALEAARTAALKADVSNTVSDAAAAQEAEKRIEAAKAAVAAVPERAKVSGDYGGRSVSLRRVWSADVADFTTALWHFRDHPRVRELIQKLADEAARKDRNRTIPGVEFVCQENAA